MVRQRWEYQVVRTKWLHRELIRNMEKGGGFTFDSRLNQLWQSIHGNGSSDVVIWGSRVTTIEYCLMDAGSEGWELVAVTPKESRIRSSGDYLYQFEYYFKRPVTE
jgi:hypothetical protein